MAHDVEAALVTVLLAAVLLVGAANLAAFAATGGPLLLGKSNTATKTTKLKTTGNRPALSLKSESGKAPLKVSNSEQGQEAQRRPRRRPGQRRAPDEDLRLQPDRDRRHAGLRPVRAPRPPAGQVRRQRTPSPRGHGAVVPRRLLHPRRAPGCAIDVPVARHRRRERRRLVRERRRLRRHHPATYRIACQRTRRHRLDDPARVAVPGSGRLHPRGRPPRSPPRREPVRRRLGLSSRPDLPQAACATAPVTPVAGAVPSLPRHARSNRCLNKRLRAL